MPASNRSFIGIRHRLQSYESHSGSTYLTTQEAFRSTEIWGRFYPLNKIQVIGIIPFNQHTQKTTSQTYQLNGLGDPSLLIQYNLLNTLYDSTYHEINQNLLVGGGIKFPLGKFRFDSNNPNEVANANFQLGTGSVDWTIQSTYGMRYQAWGFNVDGQVKLTGINPNGYRFGNRISGAMTLFYAYGHGHRITLMPYINFYSEYAWADHNQGNRISQTGGNLSLGGLGIEGSSRKILWGISVQQPVSQSLAGGEIQAKHRISTHVTWLF